MTTLYVRYPNNSGGSSSLSFADTNSINLTDTSSTITADLNLSAAAADAGFINCVLTIETDGIQGQVPIADATTTGALTSTDWNTFNSKQSALTLPLTVANGGTGRALGTSGGILGFTASTTLTSSGVLTANAIVLGGGAGATPSVLGSLGTTTTVLHGNAAGAPTFGAVSLSADVTGNLPVTNLNSGTSASATTFWCGDATWKTALTTAVTSVAFSVPASSIFGVTGSPVTTTGTLGLTVTGTSGGIPYFDTTGTLSSSGALTASRLVLGGGAGATPTVLGSLGTTTTVLHGNAAGAPSFGAVSLTADVTGALPIANGGTGQTAKAAAFDALSPMTTGGDLIYGGASGTGTRLANGTAGQYLKSSGTTVAPAWQSFTMPTQTRFTTGTAQTYSTPAGVLYLKVRLIGGGGGGSGGGSASGTAAGDGGATTFTDGTVTLTGNGGAHGVWDTNPPSGGTASISGGSAFGSAFAGAKGNGGGGGGGGGANSSNGGAPGASTPFSGGGGGGRGDSAASGTGQAPTANSGAGGGGGGAGAAANSFSGTSGAAGGYVEAYIPTPSASYTYTVGALGSAGGAGTNGSAGGAGAAGYIEITEFYT